MHLTLAFLCVLFAACASGLTIGLMSMDELELEIKERVGTEEEVGVAGVGGVCVYVWGCASVCVG